MHCAGAVTSQSGLLRMRSLTGAPPKLARVGALPQSALAPVMAYHSVMNKPYFVRAEWDSDAQVWVASSDDVSGLVTEADTIEALDAKLQTMVPELLEANGCLPSGETIQVELFARRFSIANLAHA
jgi:predicted RNase H-like HicB family nuclease